MCKNEMNSLEEELEEFKQEIDKKTSIPNVLKKYPLINQKIDTLIDKSSSEFFAFSKQIHINPIDIGKGDKLASAIMRFQENNVFLPAIFCLIFGLLSPLVSFFEGNFINPNLAIDAFHDIGYWNQYVVALPTLMLLAGMYFGKISITLMSLIIADVFPISIKHWEKFRGYSESIYKKKFM